MRIGLWVLLIGLLAGCVGGAADNRSVPSESQSAADLSGPAAATPTQTGAASTSATGSEATALPGPVSSPPLASPTATPEPVSTAPLGTTVVATAVAEALAVMPSPTAGGGPQPSAVPETMVPTPRGDGPTAEEVARGLEVYQAQYCGACHQLTAAGSAGVFGPTHDRVGTMASERIKDGAYQGAANSAAEYLRESIIDPKLFVVPGYEATSHAMPAYTTLTEPEIRVLVALLLAQE